MAAGTQWRDRASGFFSTSSMKLRSVTQTAGIFVGDVAKDAGSGVAEMAELAAEVAERAGTAMRARWSLLQQAKQQQPRHTQDRVQERIKSAAASTSTLLKRSFLETKDKVAVGRTRVEEVAKRAAQRSRTIWANIERWQKGQTPTSVFGVPLEELVQRHKSSRPIPQIVLSCADYLVSSGLNSEHIFKRNGDHQVMQRLKSYFEEDWNATIPEGTSAIDVAALLKMYLQMLPEPLLTFSVYDEVKEARGNVQQLSDLVRTIPYAHYSTLECLMSLLLRVSQKSALNKMDAHGLAFELAPLLLWKQNTETYAPQLLASSEAKMSSRPSSGLLSIPDKHSASNAVSGAIQRVNGLCVYDSTDNGCNIGDSDGITNGHADVSTQIPLDDEPAVADFAIIEAVQCLIEHQKVIFADQMEAFWQGLED